MQELQIKLKQTIVRYIEDTANGSDIIAIAGALCETNPPQPLKAATVSDYSPGVAERFALLGDDQVLDRSADLIWSRGNVPGGKLNWKDAQKACAEYSLGGAKTWRLPTIKELLSLVEYERHSPAIDPIFNCESDYYWSVTPYAANPGGYAWVVFFDDGLASLDVQYGSYHVRAVRPRQ